MTDSVVCPVCGQSFKQTSIERHVNICLLSREEKPVTRRKKIDQPKPGNQKEPVNRNGNSGFFVKKSAKRKSIMWKNDSKKVCPTASLPILLNLEVAGSQEDFSYNPNINNSFHLSNTQIKEEKQISKKPFHKELLNMASQSKVKEFDDNKITIELTSQDILSKKNLVSSLSRSPASGTFESVQEHPQEAINKTHEISNKINNRRKVVLGIKPLAEMMRPHSLDEYYGQKTVNAQKLLRDLFNTNKIPSMILWGPPGCGKTSLAHVISQICKSGSVYRYVTLSATMAGINDVREVVRVAKNENKLTQRKTVLFIDEIHRFNKLQQDSFLPHVEDGTIILIGATTENPSFHVNNALLSRCQLVVLEKLDKTSIKRILEDAVKSLNGIQSEMGNENLEPGYSFVLEAGVLDIFADYSGGDARIALNSLDIVLQSKITKEKKPVITCKQVKEIKLAHLNYDRNGDEHFWMASALQKSIRGSNIDASLYWLARMLEGGESPLYIARRLVRCASEDIGMADSNALQQAVAAYQACHFIGMPECDVILAQAVVYLSKAPKSISVYEAYKKAKETIKNWPGPQPNVPLHLRNASTKLLKELSYGRDYNYPPTSHGVNQEYLPAELKEVTFYSEKDNT